MTRKFNETEPDVKCLKELGYGHLWRFEKPVPKNLYVMAQCAYCRKKRLYRLHHPSKLDWRKVRANRKREETRRRKKGLL